MNSEHNHAVVNHGARDVRLDAVNSHTRPPTRPTRSTP